MIFAMILQNDQAWDPYTLLITVFISAICMCAPIGRAIQERRARRLNAQAQQARAVQAPQLDKNLQSWEEMLLTAKDRGQKLEAIARLGKLGNKDTLDMLSEYAENDRDPEILAAIENALELLEQKAIQRRIKGEIESNPEP